MTQLNSNPLTPTFLSDVYAKRRQQLLTQLSKQVSKGAVALISAAPEVTRSNDTEYPFRQDSDFFYLTGFDEPDAVLVLAPDADVQVQLFCQPKDPHAEVWHGRRLGFDAAPAHLGVEAAWSIEDFDTHLENLLLDSDNVVWAQDQYAEFDAVVFAAIASARQQGRKEYTGPQGTCDIRPLLHAQRLIKSAEEIDLMRRAAEITVAAHARAMHFAQPGRFEYQVAAELHHEFAMQGALHPAYGTICGGGDNACILHYTANLDVLKDGDLLLIDAGAEYQGYAADITRTFPVNGRFSEPQKQLYQVVLDAQEAALAVIKPGANMPAAQEAAAKVITKGLIELGILQGSFKEHWQAASYRNFFIHGLGHWLGLDVHDVGAYNHNGKAVSFKPGMALTIEPGIYIPPDAEVDPKWRGIGIRIEDDILVTEQGHENLTAALPKTIADIEAWLAQR